MKKFVIAGAFAVSLLGTVGTMAVAADDPIKVREELMEGIGDAMKVLGPTAQGKMEYDAAKVTAALQTIATNSADFPNHFPEGSDTGNTEALPAIWENKADFEARSQELAKDAEAAIAVAGNGLDAFKPAFGEVASNCKGCHEKYRKPS